MKKLLGYLLLMIGCFGLGSLVQEIKIRKLKKKLSAIGNKKSELMEAEIRMKQLIAMSEKIKQKEDEIKKYKQLADELNKIPLEESDSVLRTNEILKRFMEENNIPKPWGDRDFGEFMRDPDAKLKFG